MILLDVEKAFDSVWHKALLHKLLQRGCDIFLGRLIFSFVKGRSFQVSVCSAKSSSHNILFGVPQGAILSPTLYNIFTLDVPSAAALGFGQVGHCFTKYLKKHKSFVLLLSLRFFHFNFLEGFMFLPHRNF
jgi:Reverse transcriptase (RNA-dependent DNA polymerase)